MADKIIYNVLEGFTIIHKLPETSFTVKLSACEMDGFLMGLGKRAYYVSRYISPVSFDL